MSEAGAVADRAVSVLAEMGVKAEVYLEDEVSSSIAVSSGKVESLEMSEERGAGIRLFENGRLGFAYTSDLSPDGIRRAASAARAVAAHTDADPCNLLPAASPAAGGDEADGDLSVAAMETYRKTALARAMEEAARSVDPRITRVREARYEDLVGRVEIRNTAGLSRGAAYARIYGSIDLVAEENGSSQGGCASEFSVSFSGLDPFRIGREAGNRALAKLGATRAATTGIADVIFDPWSVGELLEAFAPAFSGEEVLKGKSFLAGRVGQAVAAPGVTLVDDGRLPGANGTFPFDGEGVSTGRTLLVEGGTLRGYLHNAWSAAKMGVASTGNAGRHGYMGLPEAEATTLYLEPSARPPEEILAGMDEGLRITELMGLHTVDPITGEFSLGATGHRVRGGRLQEPVTGIGLAGTVAGFLAGVEAVGSDLRLLPGSTAGSTTLVRGLAISGT